MNDLVRYTTEDGRSQTKLRTQEQTVRLPQWEVSELLVATKSKWRARRQFATRCVANSIVVPLAANTGESPLIQACQRVKS
jgi:hypothetical protein